MFSNPSSINACCADDAKVTFLINIKTSLEYIIYNFHIKLLFGTNKMQLQILFHMTYVMFYMIRILFN